MLSGNAYGQEHALHYSVIEGHISEDIYSSLEKFINENSEDVAYQIGNETIDRREIIKNIDALQQLYKTLNLDLTIGQLKQPVKGEFLFLLKRIVLANELLEGEKSQEFSTWLKKIPSDLPLHYFIGDRGGYDLWTIKKYFIEGTVLKIKPNSILFNQFRVQVRLALMRSLQQHLSNVEDRIATRVMDEFLSGRGAFKDDLYLEIKQLMKEIKLEGQSADLVTNKFTNIIRASVAEIISWAKLDIDVVDVPKDRTVWSRKMKTEVASLYECDNFKQLSATQRISFVLKVLAK